MPQICLTNEAFHTDGLRVVSRTTLANTRSWGLMKRLKMRHDPWLDYHPVDQPEAMIVHVLTYKDWERDKKEIMA